MPDTQVTGTITDSNGLPYSFAMINAILVPGGSGPSLCNGSPLQPVAPFRADENGSFALMLCPNASITPAGSHWEFNVSINPGVPAPIGFGPQAFGVSVTIAGGSQDLSGTLSAAAPTLARVSGGGGGSPGGSNTDIQVNNAGAFGGDDNFTYDMATQSLELSGGATTEIGLSLGATQSMGLFFAADATPPSATLSNQEVGGVMFISSDGDLRIESGAATSPGNVILGNAIVTISPGNGTPNNGLGFYGTAPIVKPTVTGSRAGNAAVASLLTQLAALGLVIDDSTA